MPQTLTDRLCLCPAPPVPHCSRSVYLSNQGDRARLGPAGSQRRGRVHDPVSRPASTVDAAQDHPRGMGSSEKGSLERSRLPSSSSRRLPHELYTSQCMRIRRWDHMYEYTSSCALPSALNASTSPQHASRSGDACTITRWLRFTLSFHNVMDPITHHSRTTFVPNGPDRTAEPDRHQTQNHLIPSHHVYLPDNHSYTLRMAAFVVV